MTLTDGSYHAVDSNEMSFKIASKEAFKKGILQGKPVLLEPIMTLRVTVPEIYTGDVMSDLNTKRAHVSGMNPGSNGSTTIEATVPAAEVQRYATDLRSITQGRGSFTTDFSHYQPVPAHIADQVRAAAAKQAEASSRVTFDPGDDVAAGLLIDVDPEALSQEDLIELVEDLQQALAARVAETGSVDLEARNSARAVAGVDYTVVFDGGSLGNPGLGYGSYEIVDSRGEPRRAADRVRRRHDEQSGRVPRPHRRAGSGSRHHGRRSPANVGRRSRRQPARHPRADRGVEGQASRPAPLHRQAKRPAESLRIGRSGLASAPGIGTRIRALTILTARRMSSAMPVIVPCQARLPEVRTRMTLSSSLARMLSASTVVADSDARMRTSGMGIQLTPPEPRLGRRRAVAAIRGSALGALPMLAPRISSAARLTSEVGAKAVSGSTSLNAQRQPRLSVVRLRLNPGTGNNWCFLQLGHRLRSLRRSRIRR